MAKLIYGVSGEGSGHSSRAREMIGHLVSVGHSVKVASYKRNIPEFEQRDRLFIPLLFLIIPTDIHIWNEVSG